ncbi:MAG: YitT family protein [Ruminococcaceae bacterium]|nr:YitT family protein [Oscillospiraceae bacterium]
MLHKAIQNRWSRIALSLVGTFINAFAINFFVVPMGLYSSGITGVCQLIRTLLSRVVELPAGVDFSGILYFVFCIPILALAWRSLGHEFAVRTLICTVASAVFLAVLRSPAEPLLPERLASCIVGGIIGGFGIGLTLTCGSSTGGLDVLGLYLTKRGSRFTVGRFSIGFNVVLYSLCAILFDVPTALYSIINNVCNALFIDRAHQQNIRVQVLIFTHNQSPELPKEIMRRLDRGVTYWEGKGAYTGQDLRVLCVCVSKFEEDELRSVAREFDPHAFFIVQEGVRIDGNFLRKVGD